MIIHHYFNTISLLLFKCNDGVPQNSSLIINRLADFDCDWTQGVANTIRWSSKTGFPIETKIFIFKVF